MAPRSNTSQRRTDLTPKSLGVLCGILSALCGLRFCVAAGEEIKIFNRKVAKNSAKDAKTLNWHTAESSVGSAESLEALAPLLAVAV